VLLGFVGLVFALAVALTGCAALGEWWDQPIGNQAPYQPGTPVVVEPPGGGEVGYTPPAPEEPTTKGELVEDAAIGTVGLLLGAPAAALAFALLAGIRSRRGSGQPKPKSDPGAS
jgi:predicted PurR-regulated permease PerM